MEKKAERTGRLKIALGVGLVFYFCRNLISIRELTRLCR